MTDVRPLRILHVSDTHLLGDGTRHYGVVDTAAALRSVLERASTVTDVDAVVLSGDLSDDGTPASYRTLLELVEPWAAERGAVVVPAMGNHDLAAGFEEVLGERERTVLVRGFRIVTVDTSVPGAGYGRLDPAQLERLRRALAGLEDPDRDTWPEDTTHVPIRRTVGVLHHPPVPARSALLAALELQDPGPLLEACEASGVVSVVLAGHYHHALATTAGRVPVVVAPGVANSSDPLAPCGHERADVGSGFAVVDVRDDGEVTVVFVPVPHASDVADGTELFDLGPDEVARIAAAAGPGATS
ncbi:phosphohydrolase [Luteimicrobium album]|uniref:Phosphohydrolase n=1 Tax=Luteimicrobium album TaxID=1054550 RepID=A0ABQ6I478_9MICO|nr:metallophosphoesterase [Luteimicrobium album]GMA24619.1 phosphohydrolase [Luteimicrobium album]